MDEYPDPDDEYDLLHQDELDLLREHDEDLEIPYFSPKKSKVSLNFEDALATGDSTVSVEKQKRKVCDLDLDDVLELDPPAKKNKSIDNIQPLIPNDIVKHNKFGVTSIRFPPWNFLTINTDFGERLYVKLRSPDSINSDIEPNYVKSNIVTPAFRRLKDEVQRKLDEAANESHTYNDRQDDVIITNLEDESSLWVEKFKPKKYLELLSNEGVNRALLTWIKMWDKVVFNKEKIIRQVANNKDNVENNKFKQFKGKQQLQEEKINEFDDDGRPYYKIALLCGSPGIGKTTLAHVIAVLAGYNVIEVNASDDRSIETFRSTLENSTQMQAVMGSKKPNCLILDEIDGAPAPSIDFLIKFITGKVNEKGKKQKKEQKKKIVKRPVICICNELYTPSLRQLRQQAYVIHFPQTSSAKLAQRLLEICKKQNLLTDLSTMNLLCEKAHRDIRSCISTLHFFKTKQEKAFRAVDVAKANVGLKDFQKNLFGVWQDIFQKNVKKLSGYGMGPENDGANVAYDGEYHPEEMKRLQHIVQTIQSAGDYEKLIQGVHENLMKAKFPSFQSSVLKGLDWFCWTDLLDIKIRKEQQFVLMPYLPYAFAAWHFLFSSNSWPKISYPNIGYENHMKLTKNNQIISDVLQGLQPSLRVQSQRLNLILDVLPLLPAVLTPTLRPVNVALFNEREKSDFMNLVNIMLDFNMNYIQQRSPDGSYYYSFDPSIEEAIRFQLAKRTKIREFSYNMKQLISREVDLERVRRNDQSYGVVEEKKQVNSSSQKPFVNQPLKPKPVQTVEPGQYKDFFGRIVKVQRANPTRNGLDKSNYIKSKVWYSFKEGFNNAVKKDLTIADLL